ncbi:MAG: 4Fe-4S dicluster domain-containing protein [Calditrichaeota bacterium]|nr:MAG: 4Fe-4S dicluster domain-containing protein [Calditrichota bacterium]
MKYIHNVATLKLDTSKCNDCGLCIQVCPHAVMQMEGRRAHIADLDACMECGACALNCAVGAISVRAGVGCAAAIIQGTIQGAPPSCGCDTKSCCC